MQLPNGRQGRRLMGIGRELREWARQERNRNRRIAAALDDFAASLEQDARHMSLVLVAYPPVAHDDVPSRS